MQYSKFSPFCQGWKLMALTGCDIIKNDPFDKGQNMTVEI